MDVKVFLGHQRPIISNVAQTKSYPYIPGFARGLSLSNVFSRIVYKQMILHFSFSLLKTNYRRTGKAIVKTMYAPLFTLDIIM